MHTTLVSPNTASPAIAEATPHILPAWPLAATQMPNAHLPWKEWCARQAATESAAAYITAAEQIVRTAQEPIGVGV